MRNIFKSVEQKRRAKMNTGLTLQEAIARESPEMQEKIRQETDRLRAEYAIMQIRNDLEISREACRTFGCVPDRCLQS